MKVKYLEGAVTVKGLPLPQAAVRVQQATGDEHNGVWSVTFGVYGSYQTSLIKSQAFEQINMLVMMDGYQPNNQETLVNIFEYSLNKLRSLDPRFAQFTVKEADYTVTFTNPVPQDTGSVLIDPVLYELNTLNSQNQGM